MKEDDQTDRVADRSTGDAFVYCHDRRAVALSLPCGCEHELKPGLNRIPRRFWDRWQAQQQAGPTVPTMFEIGVPPGDPDWVRDDTKNHIAKMSKDAAIARYREPMGRGKIYEAWMLLGEDIDALPPRDDGSVNEEAVELLCDAYAQAQRE